jgi:hypothetical protein
MMTHIDPERLVSIAMSDGDADAAERAHLAECAVCTAELAESRRTVESIRGARETDLVAPPPAVWARIRDELGLEPDAGWGLQGAPAPAPAPAEQPAPARDIRGARGPRFWIPLAAAALVVGLVGGVGVGVWWQSTRVAPAGATVASAELDPFPEWPDARGSAVVEQRADGVRQVVVDVDAAADAGSPDAPLREVWLIRTDGTGLISIGFLDGTSGRFDIPPGIDLTQYALVDVSAEADNGDPTHSGDSIVRGELRAL